jgi:UDP-N-acetylmuramoylalanine--D-glutamate ligase
MGEDAHLISLLLDGVVPEVQANSLQEAVELAASRAKSGDKVLLSPACASFDMFANYQTRGYEFIDCVNALKQQ